MAYFNGINACIRASAQTSPTDEDRNWAGCQYRIWVIVSQDRKEK